MVDGDDGGVSGISDAQAYVQPPTVGQTVLDVNGNHHHAKNINGILNLASYILSVVHCWSSFGWPSRSKS